MLRKRRKTNLAYVLDDSQADSLERRYKGLENPNNRCYFNAVMQCLLYSPLAKQTIESEARRAQSVDVLCEIRNLFTRMTANDAARFISPSKCFNAVMDTRECRASQISLNNRQEDVHEFLLKLLEHFDEERRRRAENFSLSDIFTMGMRSTTNCQQCLYCTEKTETLTALSLYFPVSCNEDAAESPSSVLHINSLIDRYFRVENLHEHPCAHCGCIGRTEKKFDIIKAPQLLVFAPVKI